MPSKSASAWEGVRWVREPIAWILLAVATVAIVLGVWELFGLPGVPPVSAPGPVASPVASGPPSPVPVGSPPSPVASVAGGPAPGAAVVTGFGVRAAVLAPRFVAGGIFLLPVLAVILVGFAGGVVDRARQVVRAAVSIQAVTLALGLLTWLAAFGVHLRPGAWFIGDATALVAMGAALMFTLAVLRSRALQG